MNKNSIKNFIEKEFLNRKPVEEFNDDLSLIESGILDSLGIQSLVAFLEEEFSIEVSDLDLLPENFDSVTALAEFVGRKKA